MLKLYENFYDNFPLSGRTTSILLVLTIRWHIFPTCRYFIFFSFILQSLSISFNENHNIDIKFALPDFALNYFPSVNSIFFFQEKLIAVSLHVLLIATENSMPCTRPYNQSFIYNYISLSVRPPILTIQLNITLLTPWELAEEEQLTLLLDSENICNSMTICK